MTRSRPIVLLGALALIWGSSFMFIKVADREVEPSTLILGRLGLAALTLAVVVPVLVGGRAGRRRPARALAAARRRRPPEHGRPVLAPLVGRDAGSTRASRRSSRRRCRSSTRCSRSASSTTSASRGRRLLGVAIGFVGVAVLVGAQPHAKLLGALAVVGMALCYAAGGLLTRRHLSTARPHAIALGTSLVAAIAVTPAGVAQAPSDVPGWKTFASIAVLGTRLHRGRVSPLLHDHRARRRRLRRARHVPRPAGRARLRRDLPERGRRRVGARRARR